MEEGAMSRRREHCGARRSLIIGKAVHLYSMHLVRGRLAQMCMQYVMVEARAGRYLQPSLLDQSPPVELARWELPGRVDCGGFNPGHLPPRVYFAVSRRGS